MAVEILNEQTMIRYITDEQAVNRVVIDRFITLDDDGDDTVSLDDIRRGFGKSAAMDEEDIEGQRELEALYDTVFEMLNSTEFQSLYIEMMLCLVRGIGGMPILVALQYGSPFLNAVDTG